MSFATEDLTQDLFLGGQLKILQPRNGHRAGVDPVLLAASVEAQPGQSILELGCGSGVASLCLARRVGGLSVYGVEIQPDYAELAVRNAQINEIDLNVTETDLTALPMDLRALSFDHVIANPPYYQRSRGSSSAELGRDTALAGETPLRDWVDVATRRLAPGGYLTFIQKADRLHDLLIALDGRLGGVLVQPLSGRAGRAAELVILRARKGSKSAFRLLAPKFLHEGAAHERDAESYTHEIRAVLREGAALEIR